MTRGNASDATSDSPSDATSDASPTSPNGVLVAALDFDGIPLAKNYSDVCSALGKTCSAAQRFSASSCAHDALQGSCSDTLVVGSDFSIFYSGTCQ